MDSLYILSKARHQLIEYKGSGRYTRNRLELYMHFLHHTASFSLCHVTHACRFLRSKLHFLFLKVNYDSSSYNYMKPINITTETKV